MNIFNSIKDNKFKSVSIVMFTLIIFFLFFLYSNKVAPVSWNLYGLVNIEDGIAIQGGDVVAYHTEGSFVPGVSKFSHKTENAIWATRL